MCLSLEFCQDDRWFDQYSMYMLVYQFDQSILKDSRFEDFFTSNSIEILINVGAHIIVNTLSVALCGIFETV